MRGDSDITKRALFVALFLHVAVAFALLATPLQPRPAAAPPVASTPIEPSFEVTLAEPPPPSASPALAPASDLGTAPAPALAPARALALAPTLAPALSPALAPAPSTPLVIALGPAPAAPRLGLALDGTNTFAAAAPSAEEPMGPPPPSPSHATARATALLRDPARAREQSLGLGPEGPVLRALGDATNASFAPVRGRAVFRAIADATGMVVGIEVVDCDGGRTGWANAAELALDALKGKKLRMPSTATRATMRIEVVSELKMPSGHDPGVDVSVLGVPIAKGDGKQATQVRILDPLSLSVFALGGDPVDIAAKARRVVHSRLLDSEVL